MANADALRHAERLGEYGGREYVEVPAACLEEHPLPSPGVWEVEGEVVREADWFADEGARALAVGGLVRSVVLARSL